MASDDGAWFAPKRDGYGSSRPIAWQGWAVCIAYGLSVAAAALLVEISLAAFLLITLAATIAFLWVCSQKTRGGWQRRKNGEE